MAKQPSLRPLLRHQSSQIRTWLTIFTADLVQELYLKELRSYKPPPIKANDSEGIVQKFTPPPAPKSPEEADIASQLKAYEDQAVEVEGQAPAGEATPVEQDWFEEEPEEDEKHH